MATSKVSITLQEEVLDAARQESKGNLSAFVNDAVKAHLRRERARRWVEDQERELGPIPAEVVEEVRRKWLKASS